MKNLRIKCIETFSIQKNLINFLKNAMVLKKNLNHL